MIRLQVLADCWEAGNDANRTEVIRARFLELLEPSMKTKVQLQFGHTTGLIPLQQIIDFATVAEEQYKIKRAHQKTLIAAQHDAEATAVAHMKEHVAPTHLDKSIHPKDSTSKFKEKGVERRCTYCRGRGHVESACRAKTATCFRCRQIGHFANKCTNVPVSHDKSDTVEQPPQDGGKRCPACGKVGHEPWQCERVWRRFLACQGCGSWEHPMHQCTQWRSQDTPSPDRRQRAIGGPGN